MVDYRAGTWWSDRATFAVAQRDNFDGHCVLPTRISAISLTHAIVLVGGQGTRLRPLTATRPKPMMPLVDRPFVAHQLAHLARHGLTDVVFSCGYRPDALESFFGDGSGYDVRLQYVVDPSPLGTAGAVANAFDLLGAVDDVLILNGDILTDLDLDALWQAHSDADAAATVALTPVEDPSAYGLVRLRDDLSVAEFVEKPTPDQLIPGEPYRINAGTYVLSRAVIAGIPRGKSISIEREIFPGIADRHVLFGFTSDAYWRDIGTPQSYLDAHYDVLGDRVLASQTPSNTYLGPGSVIATTARIEGYSTIGADSVVEGGARVDASIVGAGCRIGENAQLRGCILGEGVQVGAGVELDGLVVIGDGARIASSTRIVGPAFVDAGDVSSVLLTNTAVGGAA